jgi:hypothetical protein
METGQQQPLELRHNLPMPKFGSAFLLVFLAFVGLLLLSLSYHANWHLIAAGLNDFPAFYCAPQLLAEHKLYDPAAMGAKQVSILGSSNPNIQFIRLPYLAAMMWPLSSLPYSAAYAVWQFCCLGAMAGFVLLWPAKRLATLLLCCWFPPTAASFSNGQDVPFLLLWVAVTVHLLHRGRNFSAGLILSLCVAKFHLLLFVPVLLIAARLWRLAVGLLAGCSVLVAVSYLVGGLSWPAEFCRAIANPSVHPSLSISLPVSLQTLGIHGIALGVLVALIALTGGAAVWFCGRSMDLPLALGVAMGAGTLIGFHVYLQDYLLWLPLLSLVLARTVPSRGRGHAVSG